MAGHGHHIGDQSTLSGAYLQVGLSDEVPSMHLECTINPRRAGLILGVIAVYLAGQSLVAEYLLETRFDPQSSSLTAQLLDLLSVNAELTIPTWFSVSILLMASALLAVIAAVKRAGKDSYTPYWFGLALGFLYLSVDEGAAIHEILGDPLQRAFHTGGYLAFGWQIVAVPVVLLFGLLYLRFLFHLPPRIRHLVVVSAVLYVTGAVIWDAIGAHLWDASGGITLTYLAFGTGEELCEMLGVTIFIYTWLLYLVEMQYTLTFRAQSVTHESAYPPFRSPIPASTPGDLPGLHNPLASRSSRALRLLARVRPTTLVILLLAVISLALLYWILAGAPASTAPEDGSVPFYHAVGEELAADQVVIIHMPGAFGVDNPVSRQLAASLLSQFDRIMLVTLPSQNESIAFAGETLPFDRDTLSEILLADGETQFIIFDRPALEFIAGTLDP
jgi:hypothetical protein